VKNGVGILTLSNTTGTSTWAGSTTINAGTLTINSFNTLTTGNLNIGNATTTAGALNYTGAGETTAKTILLNTTTANDYLYANGAGALIVSSAISATVNGAKTFVLGGASTASNEISGVIPDSTGVTNVQKIGTGTWVLSAANTYGSLAAG